MSPTSSHFIVTTAPVPSHITPLVGLTVNLLVRYPGLTITVFAHEDGVKHLLAELVSEVRSIDGWKVEERLRVFVFGDKSPTMEESQGSFIDFITKKSTDGSRSFSLVLGSLIKSEEVTDGRGQILPAIVPPTLVIADVLAFYSAGSAVAAIRPGLKTLQFYATPCGALIEMVGSHEGTYGTILKRAQTAFEDPTICKGRTLLEVVDEVACTGPLDNIVRIPGYREVYAYELQPQPTFPDTVRLMLKIQEFHPQAHGTIFLGTRTLEPQAISHFQSTKPDDHLITYLPRIVPAFVDQSQPVDSPAAVGRAQSLTFLEGKPKDSVLYISFGSQLHPTLFGPGPFSGLVDALLEDSQPWSFIMTRGSNLASFPEELVQRIEGSDKGILVGWAPQKEILAHDSVGLMLSHGGTGGIFEALTSSVPLLLWPMGADQSATAQIFTAHGAALELAQVRSGRAASHSLVHGKIHGTAEAVTVELRDKLGRFYGEKGEEFRAKAKELGRHIVDAREPGGEVYEAIGELERYM